MHYNADPVYEHNTVAEITEKGADDSQMVTTASYKEWGNGAGPDGVYGTGDDDLSGYSRVVRSKTGRLQSISSSQNSGPDKQWFTADDELVPSASFAGNEAEEIWTVSGPFMMDVMAVMDDVVNPPTLQRLALKSSVFPVGRVYRENRGNFGYGTGYEGRPVYYSDPYKAMSRLIRTATVDGFEIRSMLSAGIDGEWSTQDDVLGKLSRVKKVGTTYSIFEYGGAGNDRIWGNGDDTFSSGVYLEYADSGEIVLEKHVTDVGVDMTPFTADDLYLAVIQRRTWIKDAKTFVSIHVLSGTGPKGGGVPLDKLNDDNTVLYVLNSAFLPKVWSGPTEVFHAQNSGASSTIDHYFVGLTSFTEFGDLAEIVSGGSITYACFPADLVTLERCVGDVVVQSFTSYTGTQSVQKVSDTTWKFQSTSTSPYYSDFGRKFIQIDRTAQ